MLMPSTNLEQFAPLVAATLFAPAVIFLAFSLTVLKLRAWRLSAVAFMAACFGMLIAITPDFAPFRPKMIAANALIGFGALLALQAVRSMKNYKAFRQYDFIIFGMYLLAVGVTASMESYQTRVVVISGFIATSSAFASFIIARALSGENSLADLGILTFAIGNAGFAAVRSASGIFDLEIFALSFEFWDRLYFGWLFLGPTIVAFGLLLNGLWKISHQKSVEIKGWRLSRTAHTLKSPKGKVVRLSSGEFAILSALIVRAPDFVSKDDLVKLVTATKAGHTSASSLRSLEVMISKLRRQFSETDHPLPIKALRHVGYVFHGSEAAVED
jgi:DNA-binding winged helix-turn-helix (wHTH) protein